MKPPSRILLLGGYGTFGSRLARLLADDAGLTLLIAGRSRAKAAALCKALPKGAELVPVAFDKDQEIRGQIAALDPDLVIDATGPFQIPGPQPYRVVDACLALGVHYLDLADATDFVRGITAFDAAARERELVVLSGLSTCPALTAAAFRHLRGQLASVETVAGGIAPSPRVEVGLNVIRAIASYAGKPIRLRRGGQTATAHALTEERRFTIRPPGDLPLRNTRFALVDVPDLRLLHKLAPELQSVWFGAGTRPEPFQRVLAGLARLVRFRLAPSLLPLAGLFHRVSRRFRVGEHRGGMFVAAEGRGHDGSPQSLSWHLIAEGDDGPFIPAMAAAALLRRWRQGEAPAIGARPALSELELADFEPFFAARAIRTGFRSREGGPLYQRILGNAWDRLPYPLQALHGALRHRHFAGRAEVDRGRGLLSRLVAGRIGFPDAGQDVPVSVRFEERNGVEIWHRTFGGRSFQSTQAEGEGPWEGLIVEAFGPVSVGIALVLDRDKLRLVVRRWTMFGVPMPMVLAPGGDIYETAHEGRFRFHVEIAHPLTGLIVRYRGWLAPQE